MANNELKAYYSEQIERDPNIIATYTDADGNTVVLVLDDTPDVLAAHTLRAEGVKFVKSPPFIAYDDTKRYRPFPGGCSVGSYRITAGTLSLVVRDNTDNSLAVLSNNHVLANIDQCSAGDDILQPGAADGGQRIGDTIADLTRWVPLRGGGTKRVDCAIAKVRNEADARQDILGIGYCYGVGDAFIDEKIWKYGRTTERTRGTVIATDAVVEVGYGPNLGITVHDCIISTIESAPGDSGSALLDFASNRIVGLLFAGNGQVTIGCKARTAFDLLNIETTTPPEIQRSMWLDISHWQGNVDFSVMKARNARGVITKICQGGSMQDDRFAEYYTAAKNVGLLVGGYIFVDPADGGAQAHYDNFIRALGNRKLDLPVAMDVEKAGAGLTAIVQGLSKYLSDFQGQLPLIYTSVSFWNDNINTWSGWKDHPLWIAYWSNTAMTPLVPTDWQGVEPVLWQYDVNDNGAWFGVSSRQVDTNLTYPSFERLLTGAPPPPPPVSISVSPSASPSAPPPTGKKEFTIYKGVTTVSLNYRTGPGTGYTKLGSMPVGTVVEIMEAIKDVQNNDWVRIGYKQWAAQKYNGAEYIKYILEEQ